LVAAWLAIVIHLRIVDLLPHFALKNPAQNNGIAVIRIQDTRSGYEGYTGDILWNGG
jgi:hypothetical protein